MKHILLIMPFLFFSQHSSGAQYYNSTSSADIVPTGQHAMTLHIQPPTTTNPQSFLYKNNVNNQNNRKARRQHNHKQPEISSVEQQVQKMSSNINEFCVGVTKNSWFERLI